MKDIVIFDIDGTVANIDHRIHLIKADKDSGKRNWGLFFSLAKKDPVIEHTKTLNQFYAEKGYTVYFITGRPSNLRADTERWLTDNGFFYTKLLMRGSRDRGHDYDSKKKVFEEDEFLSANKHRITCVYEDRLSVAKMWRDLGLPVLLCGDEWLHGKFD